jgi:hypothetical protein
MHTGITVASLTDVYQRTLDALPNMASFSVSDLISVAAALTSELE